MKTEKILLLRESLESRRQVHLDLIINEKNKKNSSCCRFSLFVIEISSADLITNFCE